VRVRTFELRLLAAALTSLWALGALYVVVGYRPGGPVDVLVALISLIPVAIAAAAIVWPPIARGRYAFPAIVWLGLLATLILVPALGGVLNQLLARGPQTLLPSFEAAYPWLLALGATGLFAGLGIARHVLGETALRRNRLILAVAIALASLLGTGSAFVAAALVNDGALRDRDAPSSRFGPTGDVRPPMCRDGVNAGPGASLQLRLDGDVDGGSVGTVALGGARAGADIRWTAEVASPIAVGRYGTARVGGHAWSLEPRVGWALVPDREIDRQLVDVQVLAAALTPEAWATAEDRGQELVEGARARHCRVAVDGPTFLSAIPQARWLVGSDALRRWRGELDYWVFADGGLGQLTGTLSGPPDALGVKGIAGTIRVDLSATDRGARRTITPPVP